MNVFLSSNVTCFVESIIFFSSLYSQILDFYAPSLTIRHPLRVPCVHRDLRFRLISFTHEPLLSRAILISVSVPPNNPKKNRKGGGDRFTAFIYMWPNSSGCNQWPGHTNQIGTPIWLTTHETVITPPRRLNLMYKGPGIDHGGRKSTIVSILNMRHPAALGNEVALRCADAFFTIRSDVKDVAVRAVISNCTCRAW